MVPKLTGQKQKDSHDLIDLMRKITGHEPRMWCSSLVGFDSYHYKYESGRGGDSHITGFSPRKATFTIYIIPGFRPYKELMDKLGPHKTGKSRLHIKNMDAIDREVLEQLTRRSVEDIRRKNHRG